MISQRASMMPPMAAGSPPVVLNLGCGWKTHPDVLNIDSSIYLRMRRHWYWAPLRPLVFRGVRRERLRSLPESILVHDLRRPLPFADNSADAVYSSHVLEHLNREHARKLVGEMRRVLRAGGIVRVAVPDLEEACRLYVRHCDGMEQGQARIEDHEDYIRTVIEQLVREEAAGTAQQPPWRRRLENWILGDAKRRGETHRWMYDRFSLPVVLAEAGFVDTQVCNFRVSSIPDWDRYGLECTPEGGEYKVDSLYVEARKARKA